MTLNMKVAYFVKEQNGPLESRFSFNFNLVLYLSSMKAFQLNTIFKEAYAINIITDCIYLWTYDFIIEGLGGSNKTMLIMKRNMIEICADSTGIIEV